MTTLDTTIDGVTVTLENIDPNTLVMADNVRSDAAASLSKGFIGSIRERGVLEAIIADRNPEGIVTVRAGHRRTLAAIEANRPTVPVMVHTGEQARVDRIIDQIVENEHRTDLSHRDMIAAVQQLALEGLSAPTIAKRVSLPKKDVTAAISVAGSTVVKFSDQLTLMQAAAAVAFDDDPEIIEQLLVAAERGQFDHAISRAQRNRDQAAAKAEMIARVEAAGLTATTEGNGYDSPTAKVDELRSPEGALVTDAEHTKCPGHAMWVVQHTNYGGYATPNQPHEEAEVDPWSIEGAGFTMMAITVCTDWKANGHRHSYKDAGATCAAEMSEDEREIARLARRRVIDNNKAWDACTPVRRAWLAEFAHRKAAPAGAETLIAEAAARIGAFDMKGRGESPWNAVGIDRTQLVAMDATAKRCSHIALIHVLMAWETNTSRETWRNPGAWSVRILTAMAGWGYTLSDVEQELINTQE